MIRRDDAVRAIAAHRGDAIVIAVYNAAFDLRRVSPSPLNYYSIGAMGQASSHALGLALALPERKIIVLDGDGSLLMNLGSLVTIANAAPANLYHFLCENGCYEANGSHPIPGRDRVDFAGLARAAGYRHAAEFDALDRLAPEVPRLLDKTGPIFATLKVEPGDPSPLDYPFIHGSDVRRQFTAAIAAGKVGR
jgi:sulfopyruvate decarboxylase subunit beta